MKTLMQIRNDLLQKLNIKKSEFCNLLIKADSKLLKQKDPLHVSRKGDSSKKRSILGEDLDNDSLKYFLEQKRLRKRQKSIDTSKKQIKISDKQNKLHDSLHKCRTVSHCSKRQGKGFQADRSLSSNTKEKNSEDLQNRSLKRKRENKKKKDKVVRDEACQLLRRAQYLLVKLKLEQSLVDAYTREGWKGQSREKIKPEKELDRAKKQILKCKLGIRDVVRQLDLLGSVGRIDDSLVSSDGSVHHEHIFCKKCKTQEVSENNDIILCDGTCNCAFHQKCIDPPLATEDIPPEDEGWLCKYCDCRLEILDAMNAHIGTQFSADCTWQDIFKEEALLSDDGTREFNSEEEWPDDESDDNDYDPDRDVNFSSSKFRDTDLSDSGQQSSTSTSSYSLEREVHCESGLLSESNYISSDISSPADDEINCGPRQRSAVDYEKLQDEMFGKYYSTSDLLSEDEDWDPHKRKRRVKECAAATTLMTLCVSKVSCSDQQAPTEGRIHLSEPKERKRPSKFPCDAIQKLRQAFAENELPSRDVKKEISKIVGLEFEKVNKWFKNARYLALKKRKIERSPYCSSEKFDAEADKIAEPTVSKCSSSISTETKLKNIRWKANLRSVMCPSKQQPSKNASLGNNKATVKLSDDTSLKKLLMDYINRRKKRKRCDTVLSGEKRAEIQMEQLCHLETKLMTLKRVLSAIQKEVCGDDSTWQILKESQIVYVPIAEVKEKS